MQRGRVSSSDNRSRASGRKPRVRMSTVRRTRKTPTCYWKTSDRNDCSHSNSCTDQSWFSTGGRKASFPATGCRISNERRLWSCYSSSPRARSLCIIMGLLDMKELLGCCHMEQITCLRVRRTSVFTMTLLEIPPLMLFGQLLDRSNCLSSDVSHYSLQKPCKTLYRTDRRYCGSIWL